MNMRNITCLLTGCILLSHAAMAQETDRKAEYVHAVTRGAGLLPWQEKGPSLAETSFREVIESRKDALLERAQVIHPALISPEALARAKENIATRDWAKGWLDNQLYLANQLIEKDQAWIEHMLPTEAPSHAYGFTCPACVGDKSQEAVGHSLIKWSWTNPDTFSCRKCNQVFPHPDYPETQDLLLPRTGYTISYYLNDAERANPDDRSGKLAWHWVGHPIHVSFSGILNESKIKFMYGAARSLGFAYLFTEDPRYAASARAILVRYAQCYRNWPYRDYWDTYADCDPMYAAWHDKSLPLEWKRHLAEEVFNNDTFDKARMMQTYWGAGRVHPSTDAISALGHFAHAYDLTRNAIHADGTPVWDAASIRTVERDLLLEYIMSAEPYAGGAGEANNQNNKAPRIYNAMAFIGKALGLPEYIETALKGYECVRDASFLHDGFSTESPAYTNMYLSQLLVLPETLHGYTWPDYYSHREGTVDLYKTDTQLRMMYRSVLDTLLPDGTYLPLSDTRVGTKPSLHILQRGLRRYPEYYSGVIPTLYPNATSEYAIFNLSDEELKKDTGLPASELYYPAWQTAILRHGEGPEASTLSMVLNPEGGHRHYDNLALFYNDGGYNLLGDLGYVGDMPVNKWIKSTQSHNLVIVDGEDQQFTGRNPEFHFMATSPIASVVEASSDAYPQCSVYKRRVILLKINEHDSIAIDIFTVKGGNEHRYRVFSDLASSDAPEGSLTFTGIDMPEEAPLPETGNSLKSEDIFGLRDVRQGEIKEGNSTVTWREKGKAHRMTLATQWMWTVEAANGPGQRSLQEAGRRVHYVDILRDKKEMENQGNRSTFCTIHEGTTQDGTFPIVEIQGVAAPSFKIPSAFLNIRTEEAQFSIHNIHPEVVWPEKDAHFSGDFIVVKDSTNGQIEFMTLGANHLHWEGKAIIPTVTQDHRRNSEPYPDKQVTNPLSTWSGIITRIDEYTLEVETPAPEKFTPPTDDIQAYVRIKTPDGWTSFPVKSIDGQRITVDRFPLPENIEAMELPSVTYGKF